MLEDLPFRLLLIDFLSLLATSTVTVESLLPASAIFLRFQYEQIRQTTTIAITIPAIPPPAIKSTFGVTMKVPILKSS